MHYSDIACPRVCLSFWFFFFFFFLSLPYAFRTARKADKATLLPNTTQSSTGLSTENIHDARYPQRAEGRGSSGSAPIGPLRTIPLVAWPAQWQGQQPPSAARFCPRRLRDAPGRPGVVAILLKRRTEPRRSSPHFFLFSRYPAGRAIRSLSTWRCGDRSGDGPPPRRLTACTPFLESTYSTRRRKRTVTGHGSRAQIPTAYKSSRSELGRPRVGREGGGEGGKGCACARMWEGGRDGRAEKRRERGHKIAQGSPPLRASPVLCCARLTSTRLHKCAWRIRCQLGTHVWVRDPPCSLLLCYGLISGRRCVAMSAEAVQVHLHVPNQRGKTRASERESERERETRREGERERQGAKMRASPGPGLFPSVARGGESCVSWDVAAGWPSPEPSRAPWHRRNISNLEKKYSLLPWRLTRNPARRRWH
ncbi:hypothetical protein GGS23DRAFT_561932 [Durotheca rogersii]|uniref:uncharacterized protein n=1 Tax=Durotheca rogersii TaxID=419775 RepID=UPI00222054D8|nr:uncharacterized protein GGS23DRAFT_561932 [Durotheca rogersii]KAI5864816.1 hypothetical protein GGS23DRAFT_561932 [Durotheca rogersii]